MLRPTLPFSGAPLFGANAWLDGILLAPRYLQFAESLIDHSINREKEHPQYQQGDS